MNARTLPLHWNKQLFQALLTTAGIIFLFMLALSSKGAVNSQELTGAGYPSTPLKRDPFNYVQRDLRARVLFGDAAENIFTGPL